LKIEFVGQTLLEVPMRLAMSALFVGIAVLGCSDSTAPVAIDGLWTSVTVPGSSLSMVLTRNGSSVSGPGTWCGEALGCGTTAVGGNVSGNRIQILTVFDTQMIESFDGTFTSANTLEGLATDIIAGGQPQPPFAKTYHRIVDPPG
jgi:hypothetical protein